MDERHYQLVVCSCGVKFISDTRPAPERCQDCLIYERTVKGLKSGKTSWKPPTTGQFKPPSTTFLMPQEYGAPDEDDDDEDQVA